MFPPNESKPARHLTRRAVDPLFLAVPPFSNAYAPADPGPATPRRELTRAAGKHKHAKPPTAALAHFVAFAQIKCCAGAPTARGAYCPMASITLAEAPDSAPDSTGRRSGRRADG